MEQQDRPGWNPPPAQDPVELSAPETVGSSPRRSRIGTGVAVAAIAIGALGIAGTAYAANASNSPSPTTPSGSYGNGMPGNGMMPGNGSAPSGAPQGGPRGGGGRGHMGKGFGMGMGIHGSFVTPKQGGGYQTVDMQRGTVTAVSKDSITVKSEDGFSATYDVTADTMVNALRDGIASVKVGDEVGVMGIENAGTSTAVQIVDRTQMKDNRQKYGPAQPNPAASPTQTA
jgi:hypothetical protein